MKIYSGKITLILLIYDTVVDLVITNILLDIFFFYLALIFIISAIKVNTIK
jgi:hypothetical protein